MSKCYALLGWSLPVIESVKKMGINYVVVSFADFKKYADEHDIPFVSWDYNRWYGRKGAIPLKRKLDAFNADLAVPLYEETVEWAGALNAEYQDNPELYHQAFFYRNKPMMKRRAYLGGIKVGLFEEVNNIFEARQFLEKLKEAQLHLDDEYWMHIKPFDEAGALGHKLIRSFKEIDEKLTLKDFPGMVESHLSGNEFSTEVFVHSGKIKFLNITEYVHLGYSNFVPAGPELEEKRPIIEEQVNRLIKSFGLQNGYMHAEWFINGNDELSFGEVAARIPGGHIMELITRAYGFDSFQAYILCHDPDISEDELDAYFSKTKDLPKKLAGCLMVYPQEGTISKLDIPEELLEHPYYVEHTLAEPLWEHKVVEREGFGNHYGTVFLKGEDPEVMRELLGHYEKVPFYA